MQDMIDNHVHAAMLETLPDYECEEILELLRRHYADEQAILLMNKIKKHNHMLSESLGRNPGLRVSALDYLKHFHFGNKIDLSLIEHSELDKLIKRASTDNLTGLFYRDVIFSFLEAEIERAHRHHTSVSLLMIDLDSFKEINDSRGHQIGDDVLSRAASIIRRNIRSMDMPGRYGGEEFVIIVPDAETLQALHSAERIRKAIENEFRSDINLTASIGIGCYPVDGDSMYTLLKAADMALYVAKNNGKNQSCLSYNNTK